VQRTENIGFISLPWGVLTFIILGNRLQLANWITCLICLQCLFPGITHTSWSKSLLRWDALKPGAVLRKVDFQFCTGSKVDTTQALTLFPRNNLAKLAQLLLHSQTLLDALAVRLGQSHIWIQDHVWNIFLGCGSYALSQKISQNEKQTKFENIAIILML